MTSKPCWVAVLLAACEPLVLSRAPEPEPPLSDEPPFLSGHCTGAASTSASLDRDPPLYFVNTYELEPGARLELALARRAVIVLNAYEPGSIGVSVNGVPPVRLIVTNRIAVRELRDVPVETIDELCAVGLPSEGGDCPSNRLVSAVEDRTGLALGTFFDCYALGEVGLADPSASTRWSTLGVDAAVSEDRLEATGAERTLVWGTAARTAGRPSFRLDVLAPGRVGAGAAASNVRGDPLGDDVETPCGADEDPCDRVLVPGIEHVAAGDDLRVVVDLDDGVVHVERNGSPVGGRLRIAPWALGPLGRRFHPLVLLDDGARVRADFSGWDRTTSGVGRGMGSRRVDDP